MPCLWPISLKASAHFTAACFPSAAKHILVTGANSGIGLALVKLLATEHGCNVYLGSRDPTRGAAAKATIVDAFPDAASKIEGNVVE